MGSYFMIRQTVNASTSQVHIIRVAIQKEGVLSSFWSITL